MTPDQHVRPSSTLSLHEFHKTTASRGCDVGRVLTVLTLPKYPASVIPHSHSSPSLMFLAPTYISHTSSFPQLRSASPGPSPSHLLPSPPYQLPKWWPAPHLVLLSCHLHPHHNRGKPSFFPFFYLI